MKFIIDFLKDRQFNFSAGDNLSESGDILWQGSVLGLIIFFVYINDITLADSKHVNYLSIFVGDLYTIFVFKKPGRIATTMKKKNLVASLYK